MSGTTPPGGTGQFQRIAANEETAVLTPVSDGTSAIDRIPLTHRTRWIVVTSILTVLLIAVTVFAGYLWNVSNAWKDQVAQIDAVNADLGSRLGAEQTEVVRQQSQIDLLTIQLTTAQTRITELADINARSGDDVQYYVAEINARSELAATAGAVANALNRCVEGHQQLVIYLRDEGNYDPNELVEYETSLNALCANAISANVQLQDALSK